jgi:hypothetical protein
MPKARFFEYTPPLLSDLHETGFEPTKIAQRRL